MRLMMVLVIGLSMLQAPSVPIRTLDKGPQSQIDERQEAVVRTADEWAALWTRHAGTRPRPAVDFAREMVVALFVGSRPTAGFDVEIVGARDEGGTLIVQYREKPPRAGAVTAQVLTAPYHLVAVPRHETVRFEPVKP